MLWKCCTQYVKVEKLNSGHRTGKGQFSFQSQRKAMPKNVQTTAQLHSHVSKVMLKNSKPGFSNTWTVNFQMFKVVLEKAEEPEIKWPTSDGSSKKQESSRKTSISALFTMQKPLPVWIKIKLWKILQEMWIPDHLTCLLRNLYVGQVATVRTGHGTTDWSQIEKEYIKAVYLCICHPAYLTYMQSTSWETLGWKKHKLESRLLREISITSDMQMTQPLWQKMKKN